MNRRNRLSISFIVAVALIFAAIAIPAYAQSAQ